MTTPPTPPTDNLAAEGGPRSEMSEQAEIASVLAEHQRVNSNAAPCLCEEWPDGETDWPTHLADALADLLAARDRRVRAEALREAAFDIAPTMTTRSSVMHYLRDRADQIEAP